MDPASLALAVATTISTCLKCGEGLRSLCQDYRHADDRLQEKQTVFFELWDRIKDQLEMLNTMAKYLPEDFAVRQDVLIKVLSKKLQDINSRLENLLADQSKMMRKIKYAVHAKNALKTSVADLENWYDRWNPTYLLIGGLFKQIEDLELAIQRNQPGSAPTLEVMKNLWKLRQAEDDPYYVPRFNLLPSTVQLQLFTGIPQSGATLSRRSDTGKLVIVDTITIQPEMNEADVTRDMQALAEKLSALSPLDCGLLKCEGITKITGPKGELHSLSFVFALPTEEARPLGYIEDVGEADSEKIGSGDAMDVDDVLPNIQSLRQLLLKNLDNISRTRQMSIAKGLARSVLFLHCADFVHKNIQPETVLVTEKGASYLTGFERVRQSDTSTSKTSDRIWSKNIYRHPTRQGDKAEQAYRMQHDKAEQAYRMQHDIYSLGVCLLEIGLRESFVQFDANGVAVAGIEEVKEFSETQDRKRHAEPLKQRYIDLAETRLPYFAGDIYAEAVVTCLTCLDLQGSLEVDMKDHTRDNEQVKISVGVQYIQKILDKLETVVV